MPIQSDVMGSKVTVHSCKNRDGQLAERETQLWHIVAAGSVRGVRKRALAIPARPQYTHAEYKRANRGERGVFALSLARRSIVVLTNGQYLAVGDSGLLNFPPL